MYIYEGRERFDSGIYDANNIKVNQKNEGNTSEQKLVEFNEGYSNKIDKVELSPEAKDYCRNNSDRIELSSEAEYYFAHGAGGRGGTRGGGDA
jgi:hypothetical protein